MWSPSRSGRALALSLALTAAGGLAACTVSPVHAPNGARGALDLTVAAPDSRLEQIAWRVLTERLVLAPGPEPMELDFSVSVRSSTPGVARIRRPAAEREMLATLTYRVTRGGEVLASGSRTGRATYVTGPSNNAQFLATDFAVDDAQERAVTAAAEAVRLALLAQFGSP